MRMETNKEIVKAKFEEFVTKFNEKYKDEYKIVYVDKSSWYNICTRIKGEVTDLYFLGKNGSSNNPSCITTLRIDDVDYVLHEKLNHTNLEYSKDTIARFALDNKIITLRGHEFCNPVKCHHVYTNPHAAKILKGQLMGQNGNSPMQEVDHVCNDGVDYVVRGGGICLKSKSHPLKLITQTNADQLTEDIIERLRSINLPRNENEFMVKLRHNTYYTRVNSDDLPKLKSENKISEYYPIIDYATTKKLVDDLPKCEVDFTVIGLGSAGTGVLDQVARSTYFKNYMLIDYDRVEYKNLRNQWYIYGDIGKLKTDASNSRLQSLDIPHNSIIKYNSRFENVNLDRYKSKYVVSGFDNLECRLKLLDLVTSKKFECEYLIDLRYLDHECSIYFIDLKDEKQVTYYRNLLLSDMAEFEGIDENKYIETKEQLKEYWVKHAYHIRECSVARGGLFGECEDCHSQLVYGVCGSCDEGCMDYLWSLFEEKQPKIPLEVESSCLKQNFIDIYKFASSFVFAAIREIEGDDPKPFTHIEAQTTVIPTSVIIRK